MIRIFIACSFLWVSFSVSTFAADPPPNIVMLIGDDQGWKDYGFMGSKVVSTPHLDRLAKESLLFKRGYVPTSLCRASLATMITGQYPHQHKITSNDPPLPKGVGQGPAMKNPVYLKMREEMAAYMEKADTLPKLLGKQGFSSYQAGKWWEANACRCGGFSEGMTHGDPAKGGRHGDVGLKIGREGIEPVKKFIDASIQAKTPFYVWYAPMMPHTPHNPPERLLAKYRNKHKSIHVAKYYAMCEWFDETIGEMLQVLDEKGVSKNTIIVYLHDNGWIQDENRAAYAPKSKRSQYDGGTRTPIMIRWPGKVTPGESDTLANSVDLFPTLLHALGQTPPKNLPGINLLDENSRRSRTSTFGEIFEHNAVDIHNPAANLQYRWVIHGNWKLIVPNKVLVPTGVLELYDLSKDADETKNLANENPVKCEELMKELNAWWDGK
ncbi:MAG: sulfatase-like hydrolase/transferase [Zavarzinella sp.]